MGVFSSCVTALMKLSWLLVAADFTHQENRVEDQSSNDGDEENEAEEQQDASRAS